MIVTRHDTVLDSIRDGGGQAVFCGSSEPPEPGARQPTFLTLDKELWEDMGSPTVITVTVVPGDLLND